MSAYADQIIDSARQLQDLLPGRIDSVIILGTGMGGIRAELTMGNRSLAEFSVESITCLQTLSAPGHAGTITVFEFHGKAVAVCAGRAHLYEGYSAREVCAPVYLLHQLGAAKMIITNASGALNPDFRPADIMVIEDHINLTGQNPIIGQDQAFGPVFTDMSQAYCKSLSRRAGEVADQHGLNWHSGIYAGITGPSLETSAERRMLRTLGADAVGMSTVLEVIAANHCGMRVLGLSAISNMALGDAAQQPDTVEDVIRHATEAAAGIAKMIPALLAD